MKQKEYKLLKDLLHDFMPRIPKSYDKRDFIILLSDTLNEINDKNLDSFKDMTGIKNFLDLPFDIVSKYAALDAVATWQIEEIHLSTGLLIGQKMASSGELQTKQLTTSII
jgi:hypothetical protein